MECLWQHLHIEFDGLVEENCNEAIKSSNAESLFEAFSTMLINSARMASVIF